MLYLLKEICLLDAVVITNIKEDYELLEPRFKSTLGEI